MPLLETGFLFVLLDQAVSVPEGLVHRAGIIAAHATEKRFVGLLHDEVIADGTLVHPKADEVGARRRHARPLEDLIGQGLGQQPAGAAFENDVERGHLLDGGVLEEADLVAAAAPRDAEVVEDLNRPAVGGHPHKRRLAAIGNRRVLEGSEMNRPQGARVAKAHQVSDGHRATVGVDQRDGGKGRPGILGIWRPPLRGAVADGVDPIANQPAGGDGGNVRFVQSILRIARDAAHRHARFRRGRLGFNELNPQFGRLNSGGVGESGADPERVSGDCGR